MGVAVRVTKLPPCDFCQLEGRGKRAQNATYDFKTKQGPWANGCQEHFVEHRLYAELGTGKGQKLFIVDPPSENGPRPKPPHLVRYQELLMKHGTVQAVLDSGELDE